jgi:hypothetical protein
MAAACVVAARWRASALPADRPFLVEAPEGGSGEVTQAAAVVVSTVVVGVIVVVVAAACSIVEEALAGGASTRTIASIGAA